VPGEARIGVALDEPLEQVGHRDLLVAHRNGVDTGGDERLQRCRELSVPIRQHRPDVRRIAAEQLVGALADHHEPDVLDGATRQHRRGNPRRIGERLARDRNEQLDLALNVRGADLDRRPRDSERLRGLGGDAALVVRRFREADRVGVQRAVRCHRARDRGHERRIEPAG
jgi:hypothetical protein